MQQNEESKKKRLTLSALKRTFQLYGYIRPYQGQFILGLTFLFFSSAANLVFPKLLGDLVDTTTEQVVFEKIDEIALTLVLVLIAQSVFSFFRIVTFVNVTEKTLASLRQATYKHLIQLPIAFFNRKRVGELNSRISSDISLLQETLTTTLAEFLRQLIIIVGGITLLTITSWKLTLFMLAILPAVVLIAVFFGRYIRKFSKQVQKEVAESNTIVEETLQGIFNVKAFVNEYLEIGRYKDQTDRVARTGIKAGKYRGAFTSFIILGLFGAIVAVIWKGTTLIATGELATGELFSFIIYSGFIGGSIGGLADVYARIQKAVGATEELMEILDEPTEALDFDEDPLQGFQGSIVFRDVQFAYPGRPDIPVLNKLNFNISQGQQVALVGPSGAGKSTIVQLILRFYEPGSGNIEFDGKGAFTYGLGALRNQMAVVPQDVLLFGGTIRENIAYGKPGAGEEEIIEAARQANAMEFIASFPEGLETIVGERGVQLSGGQRQRIAIARAVLKNPRILILDEATSALDSESERLVQDALEKLMKGRTSIVIAHRLATVRKADKILVIEKGQIVEQGTHEELLAQDNGLYQQLSTMQFA